MSLIRTFLKIVAPVGMKFGKYIQTVKYHVYGTHFCHVGCEVELVFRNVYNRVRYQSRGVSYSLLSETSHPDIYENKSNNGEGFFYPLV